MNFASKRTKLKITTAVQKETPQVKFSVAKLLKVTLLQLSIEGGKKSAFLSQFKRRKHSGFLPYVCQRFARGGGR